MKILILGGTGFLGPHIVNTAVANKHTITLFNRGKSNPQLFPDIEKLQGDRDGKLDALKGRSWDAVVDTSGYVPRIVRMSAELLAPSVKQYVFISSISVYPQASFRTVGIDENAAVDPLTDPDTEKVGEFYGPLKAACERVVTEVFPKGACNIRPGLIVGPGDPTDRFTYWPVRLDRGGEILAPGNPDAPISFIDARDLGRWIVQMVEEGHTGIYNANGPRKPMTTAEMLYGCKAITSTESRFTWVPEKFVVEHGIQPWMELTVWVPFEGQEGFHQISNTKACAHGLTFRPFAEIAKGTLDFAKTFKPDRRWRAGLKAEKEAEVLRAWHESRGEAVSPTTSSTSQPTKIDKRD